MVVSLTAAQFKTLTTLTDLVAKVDTVYIHSELESVYFEVNDPKGRTVELPRRIFEDGSVKVLPMEFNT